MSKSQKIIASLAAVGALAVGSIAMAAPWQGNDQTPPMPGERGCYSSQERAPAPMPHHRMRGMPSYEAMGKILTLTEAQQPLWQAYVDARDAFRSGPAPKAEPPVDMQERLERRAERTEVRAAALKRVASARAQLVQSLSAEQKYVLEQYEMSRRGHGPKHPPVPFHRFHNDCPVR